MKLYSYIVAYDYGLAPNPFWGSLTLTVCKPGIRRTAEIGDWIIGTGAKNVKDKSGNIKDHSGKLVFAMRVDCVKSLREYDEFCRGTTSEMRYKIPKDNLFKENWEHKVGDCIYFYSERFKFEPVIRKVLHTEIDKETDLGGENALISNTFYYFGNNSVPIIHNKIEDLVKKEQGYRVLHSHNADDEKSINDFLKWLTENYKANYLYGQPQLSWDIDEAIKRKRRCQNLKKVYLLKDL